MRVCAEAAVLLVGAALLACASAVPPDASGPGSPVAGAAIAVSQPARAPARVVLISISGLTAQHYGAGPAPATRPDPPAAAMPTLARLAVGGAWADAVEPVTPSAYYPAHATLVTGVRPDRHRVLGNEVVGPRGQTIQGITDGSRIDGTTLWRVARTAGLKVAALQWPLTLGTRIELLLPDVGAPTRGTRWLDVVAATATPWVHSTVSRILAYAEPEVAWPDAAARDSVVTELACEIARQNVSPALWLIGYEQSGDALLRAGPGSAEARAAFGAVDAELEKLLACMDDSEILDRTTIVVTGDRAFLPLHSIVFPNAVLMEAGLQVATPRHAGSGIAQWHALVRSHGSAAVVYAQNEPSAVLARRALLHQADELGVLRVVSASELADLHGDPEAWFGLEALPGYGLSNATRGEGVVATPQRGIDGHLATAPGTDLGFVAWGSGIRPGVRVPRMSQLDVAPTVSTLLGLLLPSAEGKPLVGIIGVTRELPLIE